MAHFRRRFGLPGGFVAIDVVPYTEEWIPAVQAFNRRMAEAGMHWGWYETPVDRWLPERGDARWRNRLGIVLQNTKPSPKVVIAVVGMLAVILVAVLVAPWIKQQVSDQPEEIAASPTPTVSVFEMIQTNNTLWTVSPHADEDAYAFTNWNDTTPSEVPENCAKCHAQTGFLDYLGVDGSSPEVVLQGWLSTR